MARNRKPAGSGQHKTSATGQKPTASDPSARASAHQREKAAKPPRNPAASARLTQTIGTLLETLPDGDYGLIDSGNGQKLEQYGDLRIIRPEAQAVWQKSLPDEQWQKADAIFTGDTDEEGLGRWQFPSRQLGETFAMAFDNMPYLGRFTSFRHTGVFPEQAAHWRFMMERLAKSKQASGEAPRVLNLFGYTGIASLVAARAGAHVTHVDASKKAIGWARENQQVAGLEDRPIRWICEDATRFCEREVRRGNRYDAILLDPPAYGRGPKGEVWQLFDDLPHMADLCRELVSNSPAFVILTAYSIRASFLALHELMQEVFGDMGGHLESGELTIRTLNSDRRLSTSMFSRWTPK
jgi:23S rRNA (cytosine1962-C5)-methyltransferase